MSKTVKSIILAAGIMLLSTITFSQNFDLNVYVDKNGNPDPHGKIFAQYFADFYHPVEVVQDIGGRKYIFKSELNCGNISKNYRDVILWEIEKNLRCEIFKLTQLKRIMLYYGGGVGSMFLYLHRSPEQRLAPVFYLWLQTIGINVQLKDNLVSILAGMGDSGKKYAAIIEENARRYGRMSSSPVPVDKMFSHNSAITPFEKMADSIRRSNYGSMTLGPGIRDYEQKQVLQILEQKSPQEIVKYFLDNKIIKAENITWLLIFLEMCPEWPPEAVEFLKKQYASPVQFGHSLKSRIVAASIKNPAMKRWLKPYMAEFISGKNRPESKIDARTAVAYMLISGESDVVKMIGDYVCNPFDFAYEYAHATGRYNEACKISDETREIVKYDNYSSREWSMPDYAMLFDKSDLSRANRIALLKKFLMSNNLKIEYGGALSLRSLLHTDNLFALLTLAKDSQYAANAWLAIKVFPVNEMSLEVAAQYFAQCEHQLKSPDGSARWTAMRDLRFFVNDECRAKAVKLLFGLLRSNNPEVVSAANDSLTAMAPLCIPELLAAVGGNDPYLAVRACELIGGVGLYGQKAVPGLLKQLNATQDWMFKTMIIKALALINGTEAIPEIEKYVSDKQPILAATATQALLLLKPIPKEILNEDSDFIQNYNRPQVRR